MNSFKFNPNQLIIGTVLSLIFMIVGSNDVMSAVYIVCPDSSGDFPNIQTAVQGSVDGDTIELTDGVFSGLGNRDIDYRGKAITIKSQSGNAENCIIDINGEFDGISQRGFLFEHDEGNESVLRDLTIINAVADGP
ncbi:MAG: hypothetical protein GY839_19130 [candidate division Zixibacteria bacterium]|nr:hypothetical protein [candidate division Zixibacteria bacterium]